jgi:hypothetical protein
VGVTNLQAIARDAYNKSFVDSLSAWPNNESSNDVALSGSTISPPAG